MSADGQPVVDASSGSTMSTLDSYGELLRRVSLFSALSEESLTTLVGRLSERSYARGETVWRAGDEGSELIIVMTGQLEVWGLAPDGSDRLIGRLDPGECAGEMALVLDERRSATITCRRAARVLVLQKPDFDTVVRGDAPTLARLTELLSRRAMALAQRRPVARATTVVGVAAEEGVQGASMVATAVAELAGDVLGTDSLLVRVGKKGLPVRTLAGGDGAADKVVRRRGLPAVLELASKGTASGHELASAVDALLSGLGDQYQLVVVDLPAQRGAVSLAAAACEQVVQVTDEASPPSEHRARVLQVVNRRGRSGASPSVNHCEPFVLPDEPSLAMARAPDEPLPLADPRLPASRVLRRLTRKLMGSTVGVALGGGAAFGIAHVGVLLALEEAGVPIDVVAGTSMGSIVALGYTSGLAPETMAHVARRMGSVRTTLSLLEPSVTGTGLLDGRRLISLFDPLTPAETFSDLVVPCRVVAMDIETGSRVDIGDGPVSTALRASCSIPVVFTPVRRDGHILVDGGLIDPVPGDVVRDMGADIVIAVNVIPRLERGVTTALSRTFRTANRLNPLSYLGGSRDVPDIVDVFMNTIQATEFEIGNYKSLAADVLVNVDLAEFTWIDFHRAAEILDRGRTAGQQVVPDVRAALERSLVPL